jgi:hypothetical protein
MTEFANVEWSRKNRKVGRPFIEHQLQIMDFYVGLQCAARARTAATAAGRHLRCGPVRDI